METDLRKIRVRFYIEKFGRKFLVIWAGGLGILAKYGIILQSYDLFILRGNGTEDYTGNGTGQIGNNSLV